MKKKLTKNSKKSLWKKISELKWYTKVLTVILIVIVANQAYKFGVNTYNTSLFNSAQEKMQALSVPKADYTTYQRSCSFRSVKFGSSGPPNCAVIKRDVFFTDDDKKMAEIGMGYRSELLAKLPAAEANFINAKEFIDLFENNILYDPKIELKSFHGALSCYSGFSKLTNESISDTLKKTTGTHEGSNLTVTTACYKRVAFQLYPED